ncbi:MAG TPA: DUF1778 domain-containing protein [Pyrinomonadaceae bacterium]|nr:DUF1778 domain-containing protein [Pyrinomonadaceae bacterium]
MMPNTESHSSEVARLNFRLPPEAKEKIERAAVVSGLTITDFAIHALVNSADEVLERHHMTVLSDRDRDIFLQMLDNPPPPNEALKKAAKRYKQTIKE